MGIKADCEKDEIRVDGKLISTTVSKAYLVMNKPRGYITSLKDPQGRPLVIDLLKDMDALERIFPVGRLDYDSEGLLLLTNDGEFAHKMQHPAFKIPKTYMVKIKGNIGKEDIGLMEKGVTLDDGYFKPFDIRIEKTNKKSFWLKLTIFEGRNRIIRRFFDFMGYPVTRLMRVAISDITLDNLREGEYRYLQKKEIDKLMRPSKLRFSKI
jgi:pseudouridine synthase